MASVPDDALLGLCARIRVVADSARRHLDLLMIEAQGVVPTDATGLSFALTNLGSDVDWLERRLCGAAVVSIYVRGTMRSCLSICLEVIEVIHEQLLLQRSLAGNGDMMRDLERKLATHLDIIDVFHRLLSLPDARQQDEEIDRSAELLLHASRSPRPPSRAPPVSPPASPAQAFTRAASAGTFGPQDDGDPSARRFIDPFAADGGYVAFGSPRQSSEAYPREPGRGSIASLGPKLPFRRSQPRTMSVDESHSIGASIAYALPTLGPSKKDRAHQLSQLCEACSTGNLDWARTQLDNGGASLDINGRDKDSRMTPLHFAVRRGHLDIIRLLIKLGAHVNARDKDCLTPLHYAVRDGNLTVVQLLVAHGAYVNGEDSMSSAMVFSAVANNHLDVLRYLLQYGASADTLNVVDRGDRSRRKTSLWLAVENGQLEAARLLLDHGVDPHGIAYMTGNGPQLTPLCIAVDHHRPDLVRLLLSRGASPDDCSSTADWAVGIAPLHVAAFRGHDDVLDILLDAGADLAITCTRKGIKGWTPLHLATGAAAARLLDHGANMFAEDGIGRFPLSTAIDVGDLTALQAQLARPNPPITGHDKRNKTALHHACEAFARDCKAIEPTMLDTYQAMIEALIRAGATKTARDESRKLILEECKRYIKTLTLPRPAPQMPLVPLLGMIAKSVGDLAEEIGPVRKGGYFAETFLGQLVTR